MSIWNPKWQYIPAASHANAAEFARRQEERRKAAQREQKKDAKRRVAQ